MCRSVVLWRSSNWWVWHRRSARGKGQRSLHPWLYDLSPWNHTCEWEVHNFHSYYSVHGLVKILTTFSCLVLQILLFHLPLTYYLNHVMSHDLYSGRASRCRACCSCISLVLMLPLFLLQCLLYRYMLLPYGTVAILISPGMTWVFLLAIVLIGLAFWSRTKRKRTRN